MPRLRRIGLFPLFLIAGCLGSDGTTGPDASTTGVGGPSAIVVPSAPIDLGTLGGSFSWATDVNDFGHVVGYSQDANGENRAFLWTPATGMVDLGSLGGPCGFQCRANAINNFGQITGQAVTVAGHTHAFLWDAGTMNDMGTLGGAFSTGSDINDLGEVAGSSDIDPTFPGLQRAFFLRPGNPMVELPTFGGILGQGYGLNNASVVVGEANFAIASLGADGFRWSPTGGLVRLNLQAWGPTVRPTRINGTGDIVGTIVGAGLSKAFFLSATGTFIDLQVGGGFAGFTRATDVNGHGQVSLATSSGAVVWSIQDGFVPLPDLGFGLGGANAINNLGVVAGGATTAAGDVHAVLWRTQPVSSQLSNVSDEVGALVAAGLLNRGQGNALMSKIANAAARLAAGDFNGARGMLGAVIAQVRDFVTDGTLSAVAGQSLIALATAVLGQIP